MSSCQTRVVPLAPLGPGRPCGQPVTHVVAVGCVHEHLRELQVCEGHTGPRSDGISYCRLCADDPTDPHDCPITFIGARPLPGVTTGG